MRRNFSTLLSKIPHKVDFYKNAHVKFGDIFKTSENLKERVKQFEEHIVGTGSNALWIDVKLEDSKHIPVLVKECNYSIHHSMGHPPLFKLCKWLDTSYEKSPIQHYSSHNIGVGGIVLHPDRQRFLMIKERTSRGKVKNWKFPGGVVDIGE